MANYLPLNPHSPLTPVQIGEDALRASYFDALRLGAQASTGLPERDPILARPAPGMTSVPRPGVLYRVEAPGLPRPRFFGDEDQAIGLARARGGLVTILPSGDVLLDARPESPADREARLVAARARSAGQRTRQQDRAVRDQEAFKAYLTDTGSRVDTSSPGPGHRSKKGQREKR